MDSNHWISLSQSPAPSSSLSLSLSLFCWLFIGIEASEFLSFPYHDANESLLVSFMSIQGISSRWMVEVTEEFNDHYYHDTTGRYNEYECHSDIHVQIPMCMYNIPSEMLWPVSDTCTCGQRNQRQAAQAHSALPVPPIQYKLPRTWLLFINTTK